LALAEVAAEVARDPELRAVELGRAVRSLVHAERVVELAVARRRLRVAVRRTAAGVVGRLRIEVALTEHRAAARFDDGRVEVPRRRRLRAAGRLHVAAARAGRRTPRGRTDQD